MGRDVTCQISLLRATSNLAMGKDEVTQPQSNQNCSQLLTLISNSDLSGKEVMPLSKQNSLLPQQKTLAANTTAWTALMAWTGERGNSCPRKIRAAWLQRAPWAQRPLQDAQVIQGQTESSGFDSLRSLCELEIQILLKSKGWLKLHLLKACENPGVEHQQPRARASGAAEHKNSGAAKYPSTRQKMCSSFGSHTSPLFLGTFSPHSALA